MEIFHEFLYNVACSIKRKYGEKSMNILVIGGTRFFGKYTVEALLKQGHQVTIATRGKTADEFGDSVCRIILNRSDAESVKKALQGKHFEVVIDKIVYCSNEIKYVLDVIDCDKYIQMSSAAVYHPLHWDTKEEDFDIFGENVRWCAREDFAYDVVKRQAEYAISQCYGKQNAVMVRYPFVIGKDDYTNRMRFYVNHVNDGTPMYIDNIDCQMSFIRSDEAGDFMAFLSEIDYKGAINGASDGTISVREILNYIEEKTGKKAILSNTGEKAPYNGTPEYSINIEKAKKLGYRFSDLKDWIFDLLDYYIEMK